MSAHVEAVRRALLGPEPIRGAHIFHCEAKGDGCQRGATLQCRRCRGLFCVEHLRSDVFHPCGEPAHQHMLSEGVGL